MRESQRAGHQKTMLTWRTDRRPTRRRDTHPCTRTSKREREEERCYKLVREITTHPLHGCLGAPLPKSSTPTRHPDASEGLLTYVCATLRGKGRGDGAWRCAAESRA